MTRSTWLLLAAATAIGFALAPAVAGAPLFSHGPEVSGPAPADIAGVPDSTLGLDGDLAAGFYYQGVLTEGVQPVNGARRMEFQLFDAAKGGSQVGDTIARTVPVSGGQLNVPLEWSAAEIDGQGLWLQVRAEDKAGTWHELGRKRMLAVPYAMSLMPGARVVRRDGSSALSLVNTTEDGLSTTGADDGAVGYTTGTMSSNAGFSGHALATEGEARGGIFTSLSGTGLYASSLGGYGVHAKGCSEPHCYAGYFEGDSGIRAKAESGDDDLGYAGYFEGHVHVTDDLFAAGRAYLDEAKFTGPVIGPMEVEGEFSVDGPAVGFFPRPAWDSGWRAVSQADCPRMSHQLGGDVDDYVVDMQFRDTDTEIWDEGINNRAVGGYNWNDDAIGAYWYKLTTQNVSVCRLLDDGVAGEIRIRIWVYE